ncbi:MAG TPA: hypothetical protein VEV82_05605 [Actinomycetota bacterium]|nr:hypothetical protein [Actinomycetota bacterium]
MNLYRNASFRLRAVAVTAIVCLLAISNALVLPAEANHQPSHPVADQGLTDAGEEQAFAEALPLLLNNPDVDGVLTMRQSTEPREGCTRTGSVYWVYSSRGVICFLRAPQGSGWIFDVQLISGENPFAAMDHTALATLAEERAASSTFVDDPPNDRNLVDADEQTYPFVYERIVAEFDAPRTGDFIIMPVNTADRGGKGAHGHAGVTQSRSTLIVAGRGARVVPH